MSNKEFILEELLSFEGITRITKMLDQLGDGLRTLGMLRIMKLFPTNFVHLFTHTDISIEDILTCFEVPSNLEAGDAVTISHLRRFIIESSEEGNPTLLACVKVISIYSFLVRRKFLFYVTGTVSPMASSINISFSEEDEFGAIAVHTCSREINFPRIIFEKEDEETYKMFSRSLSAVMGSKTFNSV